MAEAVKVGKITNANVYDEGASLLGRASEVKLPAIASIDIEHKGLGLNGKVELPDGLDKMEMSIKWDPGFDKDILSKHLNVFDSREMQVRSEINQFGSGGRIAQVPLVVFVTARPKKPLGEATFKKGDPVETESMYSVSAFKLVIDGVTVCEIDVFANKYIVNGVDLLAVTRANLGA